MRKQTGFNLVELLIVVAIIGILGSIGYSSYTGYMLESRRGDAIARIMQISQAQEKFYLDNNSYASAVVDLNLGGWQSDHNYAIAIATSTSEPYRITATTTSTGAQAADTECATMWLNSLNQRSPAACWE